MLITIVTPTFNSAKYLRRTIQSIKSQSGKYKYEHIVVDGGSKDETRSIVESESISSFLPLERSSMYEAIDHGFQKSNGDILCWLNSDDLFMQNTIELVNNSFENADRKIIAGNTLYIDSDDNELYVYKFPRLPFRILKSFNTLFLCQPSIFWRREVYFETGGLNLDYKITADRDFVFRAADRYGLTYVDHVLSKFRFHSANLSKLKADLVKEEIALMNKDLNAGTINILNLLFSAGGHLYVKLHNPEMILWKLFGINRRQEQVTAK